MMARVWESDLVRKRTLQIRQSGRVRLRTGWRVHQRLTMVSSELADDAKIVRGGIPVICRVRLRTYCR